MIGWQNTNFLSDGAITSKTLGSLLVARISLTDRGLVLDLLQENFRRQVGLTIPRRDCWILRLIFTPIDAILIGGWQRINLELKFSLNTAINFVTTCTMHREARTANIIFEPQLISDWKSLVILEIRSQRLNKYNIALSLFLSQAIRI